MGMMCTISRIVVTSMEKEGRDEIGESWLLTGTFDLFSERETYSKIG